MLTSVMKMDILFVINHYLALTLNDSDATIIQNALFLAKKLHKPGISYKNIYNLEHKTEEHNHGHSSFCQKSLLNKAFCR